MRYHLESTLPIRAFNPLGGRHNPFKHGMTLEGGALDTVGDVIGGTIEAVGGGIQSGLSSANEFVKEEIPGGWATVAAIAVPYAAPFVTGAALTAGQMAALAAATSATAGAIEGREPEDILKSAALSAAGSYGLSSLGDAGYVPDEGSPYIDGTPPPARDFDYIPESVPLEKAIQTSPDSAVPIEEFGPTNIELGRTEMSDIDPTRIEGVRSLVAESGVDPMSATGGRFDPFIGATPTSNIYTDLPVGYEFMGPNGMEIVGPNGKTYLQKDLYNALSDLSNQSSAINNNSFDNFLQNVRSDARPYIADYDPQISAFQSLQDSLENVTNVNDLGAGSSSYGEANELSSVNELAKDPFRDPRPGFFQDPVQNITNRASDTLEYVKNAPENAYKYLRDTPIKQMGSDLYDFAGDNYGKIGLGALMLSGSGQQPQPQGQPAGYGSSYSGPYTGGYGSSGGVADPYLLRNRVTASNVYDYENPYDRYRTVNRRYAKGGEVKHFFLGGITNTLKNVLPYAGIFAAPFISSPAAAAGIGALASGFGGRSGSNFDMKRALMGGIAAYGASTIGAGLQAAGTTPTISPSEAQLTAATEGIAGTTPPLTEAVSKPFFRDTDAMQKGVGNLLSSDSDAASKAFSTQAGTFKTGIPLVMGTTGMMAIDEANKMREEAELAAGPARRENADMLARIAKGKKRAEEAVRENPYMFAMGGSIDDELGGDYSAMGMDQGNMQKGLFGLGYAEGGQVKGYADIDFGNGSTFPKLPPMSGPLGAINSNFDPTPGFDTSVDMNIGRLASLADQYGAQSNNSLMSMVKPSAQQNTPQMSPSLDQNPNTNMGGFASPNSFYGDGGSGLASYGSGNNNAFPLEGQYGIVKMAAGGMPQFLSGGGDGMSDSIPATIGGTQEARLADGEFVIPADVVSHLGNGSSKAGAKQLYSMMDRVRKARTGNEKQGRQIKPNKLMPA